MSAVVNRLTRLLVRTLGDRGLVTEVYARNGLSEVWIVNISAEILEVYRDNDRERYAFVEPFRRGTSVAPLAFPDLPLRVDDILPPA